MTGEPPARLVDALPNMGKSHASATYPVETGDPATVFTHIYQNREQLRGWATDAGLKAKIVPRFTHDCPTAAGDFGEDIQREMRSYYRQQLHGREIHGLGRVWPCQGDGKCPYLKKWNFHPKDYDLLIGHPVHAKVPQLVTDRTVIFDEDVGDAYLSTLSEPDAERTVTAWLEYVDGMFPGGSVAELVDMNPTDHRDELDAYADKLRDPEAAKDDAAIRADAPAFAYGLLVAEDQGNGFARAELPNGTTFVRNCDPESDHYGAAALRKPPDLSDALEVVAADGTPTMPVWRGRLGLDDLERQQIYDDVLRREFLTGTLGNRYYRTSDHRRPCGRGIRNVERVVGLVKWVQKIHGERPDLITSRRGTKQLIGDPERLLNDREYHGDGPAAEHVNEARWFKLMKGMNDFSGHELGVVYGSPHPGYDAIKRLAALNGHSIEPSGDRFETKDWGDVGNQYRDHETVNPVVQAALRFGRDEGAHAHVYVDSILPEWFPAERREIPEDGERRVIAALVDMGPATTPEIADHADLSPSRTRKLLGVLADLGHVEKDPPPGPTPTTWVPAWPPADRS